MSRVTPLKDIVPQISIPLAPPKIKGRAEGAFIQGKPPTYSIGNKNKKLNQFSPKKAKKERGGPFCGGKNCT
jgi:hypothetical protein